MPYNSYYPATYQSPIQNSAQYMMPYSQQSSPQMQYAQASGMPNQTSNNGSIIWVQGKVGAKAYPTAPGTTALLMDSEDTRFYLKSVDVSGMPMPLRTFYYTEEIDTQQSNDDKPIDTSQFMTRRQVEEMLDERMASRQSNDSKRGKNNGESSV